MRRLWVACTAIVACLAVGVGPTMGYWAKGTDMDALDGTWALNVEVVDVVGMEGLTLDAGVFWGFDWPRPVIHTGIDSSPFAASGSTTMEGLGTQIVKVSILGPDSWPPARACFVQFDLRGGEDVWLRVALPPDPGTGTVIPTLRDPCLVHWLLHHDPSIAPAHE